MHSRLFEDAKTANLARYAEVHALIHSSALTALTRRSRFACALPIRCFCLSASASPPLPLRFFLSASSEMTEIAATIQMVARVGRL